MLAAFDISYAWLSGDWLMTVDCDWDWNWSMGIVGFWLGCYWFCREDVLRPLLFWCWSIFCYLFVYEG